MGLLLLPDARSHIGSYLLLVLAGSLLSLFAARSLTASGTAFLLLCGGLFRATLLAREPDLSDDFWRYLWDGRVAAAGISPYAAPPASSRLSALAPDLRARVAHPEIRTVYPPVSQAVFQIAAETGPGQFLCLKTFFAAADLSIVALLARSGGPAAPWAAALWAFHPLAVSESAGQGHVDSLGIALLLAAVMWLSNGRRAAAGVALSLSILTKYIPLAGALVFARRGRARLLGALLVTAAFPWMLAWRPGVPPVGGLSDYATRWEFNSVLYPAAVSMMEKGEVPQKAKAAFLRLKERLNHPPWTQAVFPFFYAGFFARALLGLLLFAALVAIAWRARTLEGGLFASLAALLIVSPTLHPWYLLWALPFAARQREPAFLFLSCSIPVSYALLYPAPGLTRPVILAVQYLPFTLLLAWTVTRRIRTQRTASANP